MGATRSRLGKYRRHGLSDMPWWSPDGSVSPTMSCHKWFSSGSLYHFNSLLFSISNQYKPTNRIRRHMLSGLVLRSHWINHSKTRPKPFNFRIMQPYQGNSQPCWVIRTPWGCAYYPGGIPKTPRGIMQTPGVFRTPRGIYALPSFCWIVFLSSISESKPFRPRSPKKEKSRHFYLYNWTQSCLLLFRKRWGFEQVMRFVIECGWVDLTIELPEWWAFASSLMTSHPLVPMHS